MSRARLAERVAIAGCLGRARLRGYRFRCNKVGRDGSAKANIEAAPGASVWGVLFELEAVALEQLDAFEGGYRRVEIEVEQSDGALLAATYVSERTQRDERPTRPYRQFMIDGAREHGLPPDWVAALEALVVVAD